MAKPKPDRVWTLKHYLIIAKILLAISIFFILSLSSNPLETRTLEVRFMVGESVGFDLNSSALTFGKIHLDGVGSRNILIHNTYEYPVSVRLYISSNLAKYIQTEQRFDLGLNETKNLSVIARIPSTAVFGNYSGQLYMEFRRK